MKQTTSLARRAYFSAARQLRHPDWSDERNRETFGRDVLPHGHDYTLDVYYSGKINEHDGMIVNLSDLKPIIARVLKPLDGKFLDRDLPLFAGQRPTAENLVNSIWNELPKAVGDGNLSRVHLRESTRLWVDKYEDAMLLTRCYEFAAAHRLHVPGMDESQNSELYGKCNNPHGHGHNYGLEVTIEGEPDLHTGAIISTLELDRIVDEEVFERFDHKHLNIDCPEFENLVPTSENLARVIFQIMQKTLHERGYKLTKIGLHETTKNYFEVEA
jgi:6-pyruvoyltetrahydropterin/6-carboxytetrahydropterin synthase